MKSLYSGFLFPFAKIYLPISLFFLFPILLHAQTNNTSSITVLSPCDPIIDRGLLLMGQQQYEAAILEFSSVAQNYPQDLRRDESLFQIAECYRLLNRSTDALGAYLYLEKNSPQTLYHPSLQIQIGLLYGKMEKYKEAIPYLQKALTNTSSEIRPHLLYALGLAFLHNQQASEAIPLLKSVLEIPMPAALPPLAAWALADYFEKKPDLNESLLYWKKTLELTSDDSLKAQATARSGWILLQQEKTTEARTLLEKTRRHEKNGDWRKMANTGLLQIAYQNQKYSEVVQLYKEERQNFLDARRAEIFLMVGLSHFQLKNLEQATEVLSLLIKNFPALPQVTLASYTRLIAIIQLDPKNTGSETAAFIAKYPDSEFTTTVKLLRAQDYNAHQKFKESIPMWEELKTIASPKLPRDQILFERARAYYESHDWIKAADAFSDLIKEFPQHPQNFTARLSKAISLQQAGMNSLEAWEEVLHFCTIPSSSHQAALEQIGLLSAKNETTEKTTLAFRELIERYPESEVVSFAFFKLATIATQSGDKNKALELFDQARKRDSKTWGFSATQQMVYLAYNLKRPEETLKLLSEYEELAAKNQKSDLIPAAIYYWLGQVHFEQKKYSLAANFFAAVNSHPQPGELRLSAWWYLAESQRETGLWKFAIASYQRFEKLDPEKAKTNQYWIALAQSYLGAKEWSETQAIAEKILVQDPEGKSSAQARFLLAECHEGRKDYLAAAKAFAALALLYQDPYWTPHALHRASVAFNSAHDPVNALIWSEKLRSAYPQFQP